MKRAFITGITGQDGSYLTEFLLSKGYEVHGLIRRPSAFNTHRIDHITLNTNQSDEKVFLHYGDLSDSEQINNIIHSLHPDEVYNLAAQTHVKASFIMSEYTGNVNALGAARILESLKLLGNKIKFYQASSSEIFGRSQAPQNEDTPFAPTSPYAVSKLYSYWMARNYREGYGLFSCNGILFNHESPRRGETFVTRKITMAIANILANKQNCLYLGNLEPKRDWGFTPEYVELIWTIMQQKEPDDFVLGTGEQHTVKEFVEQAFTYAGLNWAKYVRVDSKYFRPTETENLCADITKIKKKIGFKLRIKFKDLIKIMVDADMRRVGLKPVGEGDEIIAKTFPDRWWKID